MFYVNFPKRSEIEIEFMQPQEYFAILPLLIYGIAIAELVSPWRSFFEEKKMSLTFITTGIMMLEVAFNNFYRFYYFLDDTYQSYYIFLSHLLSPLIFLMASHVYTPEDKKNLNTHEYFRKKFKLLMVLLAFFVASHFINDFGLNVTTYARLLTIALLLIAAFKRWIWMVYVLLTIRILYAVILPT